jgi:polysaccharide export outer membrane protein
MQPSAQLISVAGEEGALVFLAAEMPGLQIEQAKRRHQLNELESAVKAARNELDALKRKIIQLDVQRDIRRERLGNLKNLMTDGLTTQTGVINIRSELSDIEARRQDSHLAVVQAEARLAQAEQALDRLPLDNAANLARAIAATETAIAEAQQSLTSSEIVGAIIETRGARTAWSRSPMTPAYEIVHRGPDGSSTTQAQETSSLLPGDVLKISIRGTEPQDAGPGRREQIGLTER